MIVWEWIKHKKPVNISLKQRMEGNVVVICSRTLEICYLNKIGGQILEFSDGLNTLDGIAKRLLKIYDVDEQELRSDIVDLIRELQWKRLIKLEGE